jgi:hypothetical protein
MTWKVIYQNTPYNYTSPRTLVIEAESREAALVTAYDHLTRKGFSVPIDSVGYNLNQTNEPKLNWDKVRSLGWPTEPTNGDTHIRSLTEHAPVVIGRVMEG